MYFVSFAQLKLFSCTRLYAAVNRLIDYHPSSEDLFEFIEKLNHNQRSSCAREGESSQYSIIFGCA